MFNFDLIFKKPSSMCDFEFLIKFRLPIMIVDPIINIILDHNLSREFLIIVRNFQEI